MRYYPVNLDIKGRKCLVVGGGDVGTRKVKSLLECMASVTVVSPAASEKLLELSGLDMITLIKRSYVESDLEGMFLVICATDDEKLNRQVSRDAEKLNMLCNIADRPEACNFILPSVVKRGDLVISISTSGKSPAYAKKLRKDLEKQYGEEYGILIRMMGAIRSRLLREQHEPEAHKHIFEELIGKDLLNMIRDNDTGRINSVLFNILGEGYSFDELIRNQN
jgi:precorrin-2 dehydrogenase/sirohydrochlorin ferrochelatase